MLQERLCERREALARSWTDAVLAAYPDLGAAALAKEQDPFANPLGHAVRSGTRAALEALLDGADADCSAACLEGIIRIRAVQALRPSAALRFVLLLKGILRAEAAGLPPEGEMADEMRRLEERVDALALAAMDIYARCREQVCELRLNETRRRVAWVVDRLNGRVSVEEAP